MSNDLIVRSYSDSAAQYEEEANLRSCWGRAAAAVLAEIKIKAHFKTVIEVGCGLGSALKDLSGGSDPGIQFIGVEPAPRLRERARRTLRSLDNVQVVDGRFEQLPLDAHIADYIFSIMAFHWTTHVGRSVQELARVLKPDGEMDLFFAGRDSGHEFIGVTTPILLKYMGPKRLLESASMRKRLTKKEVEESFCQAFRRESLAVEERHKTYYDDLETHWSWWISRLRSHFVSIPAARRERCNRELRHAILGLAEDYGIPFTVHTIRVKFRGRGMESGGHDEGTG